MMNIFFKSFVDNFFHLKQNADEKTQIVFSDGLRYILTVVKHRFYKSTFQLRFFVPLAAYFWVMVIKVTNHKIIMWIKEFKY